MKRNPIAKALRSAHLKPKIVKSKKIYCRKEKHKDQKDFGRSSERPNFLLDILFLQSIKAQ